MSIAPSLILTILINQAVYAVILAIYWWDSGILYQSIRPIFP